MGDYILSCCSTADLTEEQFKSMDIHYTCFTFEIEGGEFLSASDLRTIQRVAQCCLSVEGIDRPCCAYLLLTDDTAVGLGTGGSQILFPLPVAAPAYQYQESKLVAEVVEVL